MEDETWIKLYRKIMKSPIWENERALKVWIWCLVKATHVERMQVVGQQKILLKKGEFVFRKKEGKPGIATNREHSVSLHNPFKRVKNVEHQIEQQIFNCKY